VAKNSINTPLLAGYFGHGNAGDEMILQMLQHRLGPAPYLSGPRPVGGHAIPRFHFFKFLHHLRRSQSLLLGGGELFQSRTSFRSLAYYLTLPLWARFLGRPVLGFSLGLDPDLGPLGRRLTAFALRQALALWVRDETSLRFLKKAGIPSRLMPDVVGRGLSQKSPHPSRFSAFCGFRGFPRWRIKAYRCMPLSAPFRTPSTMGLLALDPAEDGPALARFRNGLEVFHRLETYGPRPKTFSRSCRATTLS
jgi:hypothetical protein